MYAPLDGGQLWYDSGGDGPAVVLMHGVAGNSDGWEHVLPLIEAAGFRWITYDLRSSGRSRPAPGREGEGSLAGDLEALVAHLGLGRFLLVGQAYGGFGAFEYALDNPETLRALVVTNSMGGIREIAAERASVVAGRSVEERELGDSYRAANPEGVRRWLAIEHGNDPPPARQQLRQPITFERLEGMRVPTLLVSSTEDVFAPPPAMRRMADRIPGCFFEVVEGAGHCTYWEQPEEWARIVTGFLRKHST